MRNHLFLLCLSLTLLSACDSPGLSVAEPDDESSSVSFREQGPPWQMVVWKQTPQSAIHEIMDACKVKLVTPSISGYVPDITVTDKRVLSLGYSFIGTAADEKCLRMEMKLRGAVLLP